MRTLVAHEPPLQRMLDDHQKLEDSTENMIAAYLAGDVRGA
nr:hypothetical protein [Kibdelosporangium sp. MJ126-NF4]CEL17538.1 hypothetical protein [Kibdelosporangium sp. MJ126-NF4]CTQ91236.1 hypothetical protein [Kibdelosporangium sp. MJ126-NF4]